MLNEKFYDKLSNDTLNKLKSSMYRAVDLIEMFFPDPEDFTQKVKLGPYQKDFIDTIQFGFPLSKFKFGELKETVDGVIYITRRQVGKSWSCAYAASALMIIGPYRIGHPPTRCGIIAASEDESIYMIDKVKDCLENSDFNDFIVGRPKQDIIKLANRSYTKAHTCSHKSIRGPSYHYAFLDESRYMEEAILFSAAIPTTTHGERWVALTTPNGSSGLLMENYFKGVSTRPVICRGCGHHYTQAEFSEYNFPEKNRIWEMPKLPPCKICNSLKYKYGVGIFATPFLNPWLSPIIDNKKLKRELDSHGWSPWARQELLGEILDEASMVILNDWIVRSTDITLRNVMKKKAGIRYVLGMDYGRLHDASSFCITHFDKRSQRIIFDFMRTVSGEYDFETDYDGIKDHLKEIVTYYNPFWLIADATGAGYSEVERIEKDLKKWGVTTKLYNSKKMTPKTPKEERRLGYIITKQNKPDLITNLTTTLSSVPPRLALPPKTEPEIKQLVDEMLKFECEVKDGGYIKYGTQDYHDDRLIALALSLVGHKKRSGTLITKTRGFTYDYYNEKKRNKQKVNNKYRVRSRLMEENY